jgi:hypothetical protein
MKINGRLFPFVFHTWSRIGNNYVVSIGYQPMTHTWGFDLHWGRRDLLGETIKPGETRFADRRRVSIPVYWQ